MTRHAKTPGAFGGYRHQADACVTVPPTINSSISALPAHSRGGGGKPTQQAMQFVDLIFLFWCI
jgi:hypothetical protein